MKSCAKLVCLGGVLLFLAGCSGPRGSWTGSVEMYTLSDGVYAVKSCGLLRFATNADDYYVPVTRFKLGRSFDYQLDMGSTPYTAPNAPVPIGWARSRGNGEIDVCFRLAGTSYQSLYGGFSFSGKLKGGGSDWTAAGSCSCGDWSGELGDTTIGLDDWVSANMPFKSEGLGVPGGDGGPVPCSIAAETMDAIRAAVLSAPSGGDGAWVPIGADF